MIVYSKKIIRYIDEIKRTIRDVLSKEIRVKVTGNRFSNRQQTHTYPINVVIYNNRSMLGYFDGEFYELGFHECLMHTTQEQLHQIIRHELAHYMTFINYGRVVQPHGPEFREFCQQMGWGEKVYQARSCLEGAENEPGIEENRILRRVQKLMALATSSNKNEAEQALIKSQQLLLKHNIESKYTGTEDEEQIALKRVMKQKKINAKMRAIAHILGTFFVSIVFKRTGEFTCLEILGSAVNLDIAEYVTNVLELELDKLWKHAKQNANLKGAIAKNSFFLGLAKGYCDKVQALKNNHAGDILHSLMVIEKKLVDAKAMVYKRLSSTRSSGNCCKNSAALGEQMGRQLNINPAINKSSEHTTLLKAYIS